MAGVMLLLSFLGFFAAVKNIQMVDPSSHGVQDVTEKLQTMNLLETVKEAKMLVDAAYKKTQQSLKERLKKETLSPADLFVLSRQPNKRSKQAVRAADYLHTTLDLLNENLKQKMPMEFKIQDVLTPAQVQTIYKATGCAQEERMNLVCDETSPYRTFTGECNNIRSPVLGASNRPYVRWLPQQYEDGVSIPRGWTENKTYSGFPLPLVRAVSNEIVRVPGDRFTEDQQRSVMFMQWGQFIDHDLDLGLSGQLDVCFNTCRNVEPCFPIKLPPNDPRIVSISCLPFTRAAPVCDSTFAIRNQINVITAFLDASQIYGNDDTVAKYLRNQTSNDLMAVNQNFTDKGLAFLPFKSAKDSVACLTTDPEHKIPCFLAGDFRADEMTELTVLHTIFLREHNRLATELKRLNPHWDKETLFQEARKIVGAVIQKITFTDYLPALLGPLSGSRIRRYQGYNSSVDPRIASVFTNAFRFGHTTVRPAVNHLDASYRLRERVPLQKQFLAPWSVVKGGIDPILRGMLAKPAKLFRQNQFVVEALRNHLFEQIGTGMDLPSLNMQRGRDHGLPAYNAWRGFCGLSQPRNEAELTAVLRNSELARKLIRLYGTPENIDLWVGAVAEPLVNNGRVGPLLSCIISHQFMNVRDGDRFWWGKPGVFTPQQRKALSATSLSRLICDNTHLSKIPKNVFWANRYPQDFISCNAIPRLSLFAWKKK